MFDHNETKGRIEHALKSYLPFSSLSAVRAYYKEYRAALHEITVASDAIAIMAANKRMRHLHDIGLNYEEESSLCDTVEALYHCSLASIAVEAPPRERINAFMYIHGVLLALDEAAEMRIDNIISDIPSEIFA